MTIKRLISTIIVALILSWPAIAQQITVSPPPVVLNTAGKGIGGVVGNAPTIGPGSTELIDSGVPAPQFNTKAYGAVCDGSHHSIQSTLGLTTISSVAAYTNAFGATPYSWITNGTWSSITVPLRLSVAAASSATTLYLDSALQVPVGATVTGTQLPTGPSPTVSSVSNPSTVASTVTGGTITKGSTSIPLTSAAGIIAGSHPVPQAGLSYKDVVVSVASNTLTMKYGATAAITNGTTLTFQPPSSVVISAGLTGSKPSVTSAASTTGSNYWVYFTWPMTDTMIAAGEMDWLGTQAAIEAATASTTGGRVRLPTGTCIMDNTTVSGNAVGGLIIHEAVRGVQNTAGVDFAGNGVSNTYMEWPAEMGAGRAAISNGVPYATWDNGAGRYQQVLYTGLTQDFTMIGPSTSTLGTIGTRTWGMLSGTRNRLQNVSIFDFYVGLTGETIDHTTWDNVWSEYNAIGLRMGPVHTFLVGNNLIDHIELYQNSLAGMSFDKDAVWAQSDIDTLYCSFSPDCMELEQGVTDSYSQPGGGSVLLISSSFNSTLAENIGEGFLVNDNHGPLGTATVGATTEWRITGWRLLNATLLQDNTYLPSGAHFNYWIDGGNMTKTRVLFTKGVPAVVTGAVNAVWLDNANNGDGGDLFEGSFTSLLSSWGSGFFGYNSIPFSQEQYQIRVCEPNSWCGHTEIYSNGSNYPAGTLLEYSSGEYGADLSAQVAGGSAPFAGVSMGATGTGGGLIVVATKMCSNQFDGITIPTSGTATALHWGKLAAGGTITNASSAVDGVVVGTIMEVSGSAARANIGPNGSCDD